MPYFSALSADERDGIEAIVMNMWEPYRKTVRELVPDADAKIVFDKFHVLLHVNAAVDTVRKQEHRGLVTAGDTRLTRTKYQWLKNPANFSAKAWREFRVLRTSTLQSALASAITESLRRLWDYLYAGAARTFFRGWYFRATHSRLAPIVKVARMLKAHLHNILTYLKHRVRSALTEGLNAKIQWIKYASPLETLKPPFSRVGSLEPLWDSSSEWRSRSSLGRLSSLSSSVEPLRAATGGATWHFHSTESCRIFTVSFCFLPFRYPRSHMRTRIAPQLLATVAGLIQPRKATCATLRDSAADRAARA